MNALLVDDTGYIRIILSHLLTKIGHTIVAEASDGRQALQLYKRFNPDFVIMDISMPNVDGLNAVKSIIELDPWANIIMCSALAHKDLVIKCIKAGAKDFIAKPFDVNALPHIIDRVLKQSKK